MKSEQLSRSLRRLMMFLIASGSNAAAGTGATETSKLIEDIHRNSNRFAQPSRDDASEATTLARRAADEVVRAIEQVEALSYCNERATVYLAGDDPDAPGELHNTALIHLIGSWGHAGFTFVSGTNLSAVVAAINTQQYGTGVEAMIAPENPHRIKLQSILPGPDQFVTVQQSNWQTPIVYPQPTGWTGVFEWTDYGCAFGVPACSFPAELYLSTNATLTAYGAGTTTLIFQANAGMQFFSFASGTTQGNIISAINTFQYNIGAHARQCESNSDRIALRSNLVGEYASVEALQVGGTPPIIFSSPNSVNGAYSLLMFGLDGHPGDVDCDNNVNIADLLGILNSWGLCPQPPTTCPADLTGNATVDVDDLLSVVNNWAQFD